MINEIKIKDDSVAHLMPFGPKECGYSLIHRILSINLQVLNGSVNAQDRTKLAYSQAAALAETLINKFDLKCSIFTFESGARIVEVSDDKH